MTRQVKYLTHNACSVSGLSANLNCQAGQYSYKDKVLSLQGRDEDRLMLSALGSCFSRTIHTPFLVVIVSFFGDDPPKN